MPIVEAAREINRRQRERVVEKLLGELKILKGRTIGLLGLAFKPNTDDLREAPAIDIARKLIERGCKVKVHDPVAMERFRARVSRSGRDLLCDSPEKWRTKRTRWCWSPNGSNTASLIGKRWRAACDRRSCWMAATRWTARA